MRFLRGTAFDLFGYTAERKEETALITWFESILSALPPLVNAQTVKDAHRVLEAPLEFRGYGPVKEEAVRKYKPAADALLAQLGEPSQTTP